MESAQSHIQVEPKICEHGSAGVGKHRVSAERRTRKTTAVDDNEGLVYSKEELFGRLRQAEKDPQISIIPYYTKPSKPSIN